MSSWLVYLAVFGAAYAVNMTYITVFYHRAFTHNAIILHPRLRGFVIQTSIWMTGLDIKGWACMHRLHHRAPDTPDDPHSPMVSGFFGLFVQQLKSYEKILRGLIRGRPEFESVVLDLEFPVHWLNRRRLWPLPYVLHLGIAGAMAYGCGDWIIGACYWLGIMSHPIQGWAVNAFGHRFGYRTFATNDNSRNNTLVGLLVWGEGYHNNHHQQPLSARFSYKWYELDMGFLIARVLERLGLCTIRRRSVE